MKPLGSSACSVAVKVPVMLNGTPLHTSPLLEMSPLMFVPEMVPLYVIPPPQLRPERLRASNRAWTP